MHRQIVYPGAIPLETDLLNTNKYAMIGLAKLAAGILGTGTFLNGLACTPDSPASLQVKVAPGEIYSLQNIDGTAYSSLAADTTHSILKQGILLDGVLLSCPAPATSGYSINYLVQVAYQDQDSDPVVLPYYNASNPAQAYSGPNNSGAQNYTTRKGVCTVSVKAGVAAATGSQTTPAPDAGYIGAYVVTVANGQTQILSGNISVYPGAPFLPAAGLVVGGLQGNACNISAAGGSADAITGSYSPGITALTNGMTLYVRAASANTTTTPTFTPNSGTIPAKTIVKGNGLALVAGDIAGAGHWIELQYDQALDKWVLLNPATGVSSAAVASVSGAFKNLQLSASGTAATVSVSADELVVEDSSNTYKTTRSVSLAINSAASGANGLDTGTLAASTWYAVWVIYNPTAQTTAGLLSLSATAPTMPSGYTMKARVGWIRTDSTANKYPLGFKQYGRHVQYVVASGSNVTAMPVMVSGTQGSVSTPTWVAVATGAFVPTTASEIDLVLVGQLTTGSAYQGMVAPNSSYGGYLSSSNPPPISDNNVGATTAANGRSIRALMVLESANIYVALSPGSGTIEVLAAGWVDNI
jgi:hypothetical protein